MNQFIEGTDADFEGLGIRAIGRCIRYRSQAMPPGCNPTHAHVGFEVNPLNDKAILYVERGVEYSGTCEAVHEWLRTGERRFASFDELRIWIQKDLAGAYGQPPAPAARTAGPLTDFGAVSVSLNPKRAAYLDETEVFNRLARRVRGQDAALHSLVGQTCRHLAKPNPTRPAVFFAVGETGVRKTHSAQNLAQVLSEMGNDRAHCGFVRLDMAEYQEGNRISQLTGAPQGYIGFGEGSQLVDALRANPKTVVLFDEIEKAHPSILRFLMGMMDAGRLSTAAKANGSREIDCRSALIIFTSNAEATGIINELEQRNAFGQADVEDEVCRRRLKAAGISPEIVGRIGRFLVFRSLSAEARAEIVTLAVADVAREYGLEVQRIEPAVVVSILESIRSQGFGVRPERYQIDELLGGKLAQLAATGVRSPIVVKGPPFECVPLTDQANAPQSAVPPTTP
ncbi:MAG: AAA family ATPase [Verrucomicrobia bacterium]|nr:AAA family ATPase [Verrucomicrobiota bacterium]